jgi:hypothetical protein
VKDIIEEYLEMSGQSYEELMAGAKIVGLSFIATKLVPQALHEQKKIVWRALDGKGRKSDAYTLEPVG